MHKTFDVQGTTEVEIRLNAGDIQIDPTLDGRVEIELTAHDEEAQEIVDAARVEQQGNRVLVDVPQKRGGFSFGSLFGRQGIDCRVRCPEGSLLTVRTKSADLSVRGAIGGMNVATASGDVEADRVNGGVNIKSASGDVRVSVVTAGANVQSASGDVEIGSVKGAVNVNTASGDVTINEAADNVNVNTVSGDTSSELEVSPEAPATDGPLVEIRAKTVSGDIRITRAPAPIVNEEHQEVHA